MPSDYERILEQNLHEYGHGDRHLKLLGELYPQRTHFILELIQNAEDVKAKRLEFRVFDDRLEVVHDGRLFDERDVRGVCGVGDGTKAEDLTSVGRFGVGFKSVFAYTKSPVIHSGDEHFRIEQFIRPHAEPPPSTALDSFTSITLPFNAKSRRRRQGPRSSTPWTNWSRPRCCSCATSGRWRYTSTVCGFVRSRGRSIDRKWEPPGSCESPTLGRHTPDGMTRNLIAT